MTIYRALHLFNHLSIKGPSMVTKKAGCCHGPHILLILAAAFSPGGLLYNNIVNSLIMSGVVSSRWWLGVWGMVR